MDRFKKGMILLFVFLLVVMTACNNNSTSSESSSSSDSKDNSNEVLDPFGKYEKPVKISIGMKVDPTDTSLKDGDTPENNQYTRYVEEKLNIKTEVAWTAPTSNYDQKVSLSIASNDLPDALIVGAEELRQMVEAGQLEDLTDVYDKYASDVMKEYHSKTGGFALKSATFDGKLMAIPSVQPGADGYHLLWIRKDWLDKLGLGVPKTIDELEKVAKAFIEQDPDGNGKNDTIGITGPQSGGLLYADFLNSNNNIYGLDPIFSAFNAYPGYWLEGKDGKPVYGSILPETKEALKKLKEFYQKGLIDKEMGIREDSAETIVSGKSGIFFGPWWMAYGPLADAIKNNPNANWQAYALPLDKNGEFSPHIGTSSIEFAVVRKGYEHPEAVVKMLNLLIRDEGSFDLSKGAISNYPLRMVLAPPDETEYSAKTLREILAGTKKPEDFANTNYKLLKSDIENIKKIKKESYDKMDIQYWDPNADFGAWQRAYSLMVGGGPLIDTKMNKVRSLIYSQTPTMEKRWVNLKKLEDETFYKIIMGRASINEFDKFVDKWKKQGGDQITDEVAESINN